MKPQERYEKLEQHLADENPVLLEVIKTYKELDKIAYKTGLLTPNQTYASQISWWPLISLLGTFSAGKSSFINQYTGRSVQLSGNQAVDDKFTVICYGHGNEIHTLPGLALDADPRFPFFGIAKEIEAVDEGEGGKIDQYMQLKTVPEKIVKGKILIDSPGFDADAQRDSTLRITDHIIEMSDLVLVLFDARHPEPGAMRDTLEQLVKKPIDRNDRDKILYVLNQIDATAQEDNPEEVISSWQRALSQQGLIMGNFFTIYNEELAAEIEDPALAERFKRKKDQDLALIHKRMDKVSIERAYRITHEVEHIANDIQQNKVPRLKSLLEKWRKHVLIADTAIIAPLAGLSLWALSTMPDMSNDLTSWLLSSPINGGLFAGGLLIGFMAIHFSLRSKIAHWHASKIEESEPDMANALLHNNRFWRGIFARSPRGWSGRTQKRLLGLMQDSKRSIQKLTDQFANPSGTNQENELNRPY